MRFALRGACRRNDRWLERRSKEDLTGERPREVLVPESEKLDLRDRLDGAVAALHDRDSLGSAS